MRLVLVEWADSFGCSAHWEKLPESPTAKVMICKSVGWLFYDGDDCKIVIPHITDDSHDSAPHQGCGDMTIPSRCITRMVTLSEEGTRKGTRRRAAHKH